MSSEDMLVVRMQRSDLRSAEALHVLHAVVKLGDSPSHGTKVFISGDDASKGASDRKEHVKRCIALAVALADV